MPNSISTPNDHASKRQAANSGVLGAHALDRTPQQQTFAFWEEPAIARPMVAPPIGSSTVTAKPKRRHKETRFAVPQTVPEEAISSTPAAEVTAEKVAAEKVTTEDEPASLTREALLQKLRRQTQAISDPLASSESIDCFSTGSNVLDSWLPDGGMRRGTINEWISETEAGGAGTLSLIAAAKLMGAHHNSLPHRSPPHRSSTFTHRGPTTHNGPLIVVDPGGHFYAPAAIACGIPAERIVWCRVTNRRDAVWTLDQSLRCGSVAAVWSMLPWNLDDRDARRLQLAAETGQTPGLFVRTASAGKRPSFASVRWHVRSVPAAPEQIVPLAHPRSALPPINLKRSRDLRVTHVSLPHAKGNVTRQAFLALTPDAAIHNLDSRPFLAASSTTVSSQPTTSTLVGTSDSADTSTANTHEKAAVHLAAQLAHPTSTRRDNSQTQRNANSRSNERRDRRRRAG
ncbi:ImuA family protein [Rhodopirellula halodulae]|uniref:ImuA family protein n=1 Tax=Rhodopirellula halodulae TaxID=2894198 RepID=UPI001E5C5AA4|nr:hypothetical protein [Rhodopirellula sp. JC737]MCC9656038.1 hypothetical protein [Rhodopirellula sp. JC737]